MDAADPARLVAGALSRGVAEFNPDNPLTLVAAGKAAVPMVSAFAAAFPGRIASGVVAAPRAPDARLPSSLDVIAAAHPDPDAESERAGRRALELVTAARGSASLVVLLSGGASAMLAVPAAGLSLEDKATASRRLMEAGCAIDALNCVRKHLSAIKGGRLAAAAGVSVTLAISDVHGPVADDPAVIGSGPTVADPTTYAEAVEIGRAAELPPAVVRHLERGARGEVPETIKPGDPRIARAEFHVIGNRRSAMEGAADAARRLGFTVQIVEPATGGEAREAGRRFHDAAVRMCAATDGPACVIGSGETTVTVRGGGRGGRNQEFVLGAIGALSPQNVLLASAGTDGIDGPTDAAGAIVDASSLGRARQAGLDPAVALDRNDAYPFFRALGDLIVWGPTGTNVGDLHVYLRS